jgi:AbrB family looped-hinge helix DNA binding protein
VEEPEMATVGTKGQVVIPVQLRKELGIKPNTKLAMYNRGGRLVAAKVEAPTIGDELEALFHEIDDQRGIKAPTEQRILAAIQEYRKEKRASKGA